FQRAGVLFAPGKAANAGGVATSALEMSQNAARQRWTFNDSENKLREIMRDIHQAAFAAAEKYGVGGDYVAGANIAGFQRVAAARAAQVFIRGPAPEGRLRLALTLLAQPVSASALRAFAQRPALLGPQIVEHSDPAGR